MADSVDMRSCVVCLGKHDLEIHHRNGSSGDHRPENCACLCRPCHDKIHATAPNGLGQRQRHNYNEKVRKARRERDTLLRRLHEVIYERDVMGARLAAIEEADRG